MHTVYQTDSFVLQSTPFGEANKYYDLLTRDFGLVHASAQGVRLIKSKLRYSLSDFSFTTISLVRGKEFWRIVNAVKKGDVVTELDSEEKRLLLYRIFNLLRRLLSPEGEKSQLFILIEDLFTILKDQSVSIPDLSSIEELSVLRILYLLGYVKDDEELREFVHDFSYEEEVIKNAFQKRKLIITEINRALSASHL